MTTYDQFLRSKIPAAQQVGFEIEASKLHSSLFPHQRDAVLWALRGGRRALFESFGLGKTRQQLEILRQIHVREKGRHLIVCPLGVMQEFKLEASEMGIKVHYVRTDAEIDAVTHRKVLFHLTNYERVRDGHITPEVLSGYTSASLDEASVLRGYGTKTYQEFLPLFKDIQYRFVATATPSPNRYKELIHYAGFLGIMDTGQALTRWFQRDSTKAGNLTLYPHKEEEFWKWVSTWALFVTKPSDLGHSDEGYDLPPLDIIWHELDTSAMDAAADSWGQHQMFADAAAGLREAAAVKRDTLSIRMAKARELIETDPDEHWLLWHHLEAERKAIEAELPEVVTIYGSQDLEEREGQIIDFSEGRIRILAPKPEIAGSGCNFQHYCARAIFLGINYKFNDLIQAIHRIYRFQQKRRVEIHIIYTDAEQPIRRELEAKWKRHDALLERMREIVAKFGLSKAAIERDLGRTIGQDHVSVEGDLFTAVHGDCVEVVAGMESESVDLIHTSIPFGTQYEYCECYDEETEVLTRRGWLSFGDVGLEDELATVNASTLRLEWQLPSKVFWQQYSGEMLHFRGRNSFDLLVTPNHKMFLNRRVGNHEWGGYGELRYEPVGADSVERDFVHRKWQMLSVAQKEGGDYPEYIEIPKSEQRILPGTRLIERIKTEDFMRLAGWYLSEGCCSGPRNGRLFISQSEDANPIFRAEIIELLDRIGLHASTTDSTNVIAASSISVAHFLSETFGNGSHEKRIPRWVKDLHPRLLRILRDTMMKGDGNANGYAYTSYSSDLRDDFQELCLLTGWRASVSGNVVRIGQTNTRPELRTRPERQHYSGMIGCATVPNHTLVVRRNGKAIVSGNSYNDFGHNDDNDGFFRQMDFLIPELLRVLRPGRVAAIHVKDRIRFGNVTGKGMPTVDRFSDKTADRFEAHGFEFFGRITVTTDVVRENNQTYRLGWSEMCKDGTKMGVGMPEYVLLFRRLPTDTSKSYADVPVVHEKERYTRAQWQIDAHGHWRSSGNRLLRPEELASMDMESIRAWYRKYSDSNVYDYEEHVQMGRELEARGHLPASFMLFEPTSHREDVWTDVSRMRTLNTEQSRKREMFHVCPLQIDIVERIIERFSNPGEIVIDPFAGLFTVPYVAVKMGRFGSGVELNEEYFRMGVGYCRSAEAKRAMPTLFDMEDSRQAA